MKGCLEAIVILIVLIALGVSILGFWHFVNSDAMEAQTWKIVEGVSGILVSVGKGFLVVLCCGGFFLVCSGIKQAAEPMARAAGTYVLSRKASQLMLPGAGVKTPNIEIWPPPDSTQLVLPEEIIGGDLPVRDVRLLESEHQT